jgi:peptide/nickel transport system substrate-binding protein
MIQASWPASLSPGNEQLFRWSSEAAKSGGTLNYPGVANPAVDQMIREMLASGTAEDFTAAVRALDRLLLSGDYVIPLFHLPKQWVAHWRHLHHPAKTPLLGYNLETWWRDDG